MVVAQAPSPEALSVDNVLAALPFFHSYGMLSMNVAILNAMKLIVVLGGSTNAVLHLLAIAREANITLNIDDFDRIAETGAAEAARNRTNRRTYDGAYRASSERASRCTSSATPVRSSAATATSPPSCAPPTSAG